jgi:hypothetical protein
MKKNILVIAKHNQAEALRVAAGLTLVDDVVKVAVLGRLEESASVREQLDALDFAEVPREVLNDSDKSATILAQYVLEADVVYMI